jgi:hypothetical protein
MVENGHFMICPLLTAEHFVCHCEERGIRMSLEHLSELPKVFARIVL